jgi:hypothetical protein
VRHCRVGRACSSAHVSISLTEYPLVVRVSASSRLLHPPFPSSSALGLYQRGWCSAGVAESCVLASSRPPGSAPPLARERAHARYAELADASGSSPGGELARDAGALRVPATLNRLAVRGTSFTTRRDTHTRRRSLRSGVGISPVPALTILALERRGWRGRITWLPDAWPAHA